VLLPYYCHRWDWSGATHLLEREGRALIARADRFDRKRLERRVLVAPMIGLEDSSRYWSYAMVLEHLAIIGRATEEVIVRLARRELPERSVRTAELKPSPACEAPSAVAAYSAFLTAFSQRMATVVPPRAEAPAERIAIRPRRPASLASRAEFPHPWFGPLDAFEWVCFLPMHQRIHVRQADRILRAPSDREAA
jgi:hypothetical protein